MLSKFINTKIFLISLAVGIFFIYINQPAPTIIYVYPTPDNVNKIQYKDKADTCYQFTSQEVSCPNNKNIKEIPAQTTKVDKTPDFFKRLTQN